MKFIIQVNASPYEHPASVSALKFSHASVERGHDVIAIFFYHSGVHTASVLPLVQADEFNIRKAWEEFSLKHGCRLIICSTAGFKRGVLTKEMAHHNDIEEATISPHFEAAGLAQFAAECTKADRLICFQ